MVYFRSTSKLGVVMNYGIQKMILKALRKQIKSHKKLDTEFRRELIDVVNCLIGRINCYTTSDDKLLEQLAIEDELRMGT